MFCTRCKNVVIDCECDDIEERLERLAEHPNFETNRCRNCQEHRQGCECDEYDPYESIDRSE